MQQIQAESRCILQEWNSDPDCRLWSFKELLSWKIPSSLLSTTARHSQQLLKNKEEEGMTFSYAIAADLYQLDLVTQRVKEQKVSFVGIVNYVKSNDRTKDCGGPIITS